MPLLEQCIKCSYDVVVSYGSHLYDGTPEDTQTLNECQALFPQVKFVKYDVGPEHNDGFGVVNRPTAYWHNVARWTGIQHIANKGKDNSWVLLIDSDEIPEGDVFSEWFQYMEENEVLNPNDTYKLANYWYFKHPCNRARVLEDSVLLMHSKHMTKANIFQDWERDGLIAASKTSLMRQTRSLDNGVMFHHFSWVRTRAGLTHKIMNWGHANEYGEPQAIIDKVFADDEVNDVIKGYQYDKVPNMFDIRV